jgi:hypothetical protein
MDQKGRAKSSLKRRFHLKIQPHPLLARRAFEVFTRINARASRMCALRTSSVTSANSMPIQPLGPTYGGRAIVDFGGFFDQCLLQTICRGQPHRNVSVALMVVREHGEDTISHEECRLTVEGFSVTSGRDRHIFRTRWRCLALSEDFFLAGTKKETGPYIDEPKMTTA